MFHEMEAILILKALFCLVRCIQYRFITLGIVLVSLLTAIPAGADVISIDPNATPTVTLPAEDATRLEQLQHVGFPSLESPLSPDGKYVIAFLPDVGLAFLNVRTGQKVAVSPQINELERLTEYRWLNNRVLVYIGMDQDGTYHRVQLNPRNGELSASPLPLPGYPMSLSNRAEKVLLAQLVETVDDATEKKMPAHLPAPPIRKATLPNRFARTGPAKFAYEDRLNVLVATTTIACVAYDLTTDERTPLLDVPLDTAFMAVSWSPRDRRLAIIGMQAIDDSRSGQVSAESPEVQDALGQLPPAENPYCTSNVLHLFHFTSDGVEHNEMHPETDAGTLFRGIEWDPSGIIFVAKMWTAGTPKGRTHPIYTNPNGSEYHVYLFNGRFINKLDRPEVAGLNGWAYMISPVEMLIHTPYKLDFNMFRYNLLTQKLARLSTPPGSVYQVLIAPLQRQIVYNFSSYQQPYELFRLWLNKDEPVQITHCNDSARDLNQVRADQVQFKLADGAERMGYLIQPADASFPPNNIPIVVWQQGGPTAPMTQEWGSNVESPFNLLPNFGIAVLVVPLPGRDGFGREFLDELVGDRNFGQIDIDEQVEIIDQMVDRGYTSWDQTGVTGCSYGGYFASQSVTRHSGVYAAANPQCSLLDLNYEWDMGNTSYITYLVGRTPEDHDEYDLDSPISRADLVDTPTLIFAGTNDFLPSEFSRQFHDQINAAGTAADYYEFIDEPHGLHRSTSQFVAGQAQLEWFRDYLKP